MALILHDGFETGGADAWEAVTGAPTLVGTHPKTGNYEMRCNSSIGYVTRGTINSKRYNFQLYIATTPSVEVRIFHNQAYYTLRLDTDRHLNLYDGSNTVLKDSGTTALDTGKYYRISISIRADGTDEGCTVYIDGLEELSVDEETSDSVGNLALGVIDSGTYDIFFDDYTEDGADGSRAAMDDIRTLAARPVAEGTDQDVGNDQWQDYSAGRSPNAADYNGLAVDPPNSNAGVWEEANGVAHYYSVGLDDCGSGNLSDIGGSDIIEAVNFMFWYHTDGGGISAYYMYGRDASGRSSTVELDDPKDPTWIAEYKTQSWVTTPAAWTQTNFNSQQMGMMCQDSGKDMDWFEAYAMVAFKVSGVTTHSLAGTSSASATTIGNVEVETELAGNISVSSTTSGDLDVETELAGDVSVSVTTIGQLDSQPGLIGSISAAVTTTGALTQDRFFTETFEASGYDNSWTEVIEGIGTNHIDENQVRTDITGAPASWGDDCCECLTDNDTGDQVYTYSDLIETRDVTHAKFEVIFSTILNIDTDGEGRFFAYLKSASGAQECMIWRLYYDVDTLKLQCGVHRDGAVRTWYDADITVVEDTVYVIEGKWDNSGDAWAWRIDGVAQPNNIDGSPPVESEGTLTSGHGGNIDRIYVGAWGIAMGIPGATLNFDNITLKESSYDFATYVPLAGNASATATPTGVLDSQPGLAGTVSAVSTTDTSEIYLTKEIAGQVSVTAIPSGDLDVITGLAGNVVVTSTVPTANLDRQPELAGSIFAANPGDTCNLTVTSGFTLLESLTCTGTATITGNLDSQPSLQGSISTTSITSANLDSQPGLAGSISATAITTGQLDKQPRLIGTSSTTVGTIGNVKIITGLQGISITTVTSSGILTGEFELQGSSSTIVTSSGDLGVSTELQGLITVVVTMTGVTRLEISLQGVSSASVVSSGDLTLIDQAYSRGNILYSDETDEPTAFSESDYTDVESDNGVRVDQLGQASPSVFVFKDKHDVEDNLEFTWNGQTDVAPSVSAAKLQIYNFTDLQWDDLDEENSVGADTDFNLEGNVSSDLDKYYDPGSWTVCRVYQEPAFV